MDTIIDRQWYDGNAKPIDDIQAMVASLVTDSDQMVRIGTDAQRIGRGVDFVTVVVVYKERKGGRMFYCRTRASRTDLTLWEKLSHETWYSLETAMALEGVVPFGKDQIEVHADANPDSQYASNNFVRQIAGMIMGQGFRAVLKPNAWVSSHAADHLVKNKHLSGRERRAYRRGAKRIA